MNFLNLKDLQQRLALNDVSEKESLFYLIANWLVFGTLAFGLVDKQHDNPGVMLMLIMLPIIGLYIAFKANTTSDNTDFLKRYISIHWVLGLRYFLILFACLTPTIYLCSSSNNVFISGFVPPIVFLAIIISFYIHISKTIKGIKEFKDKPKI